MANTTKDGEARTFGGPFLAMLVLLLFMSVISIVLFCYNTKTARLHGHTGSVSEGLARVDARNAMFDVEAIAISGPAAAVADVRKLLAYRNELMFDTAVSKGLQANDCTTVIRQKAYLGVKAFLDELEASGPAKDPVSEMNVALAGKSDIAKTAIEQLKDAAATACGEAQMPH